jgi:ABC-2 type transport system permease protein
MKLKALLQFELIKVFKKPITFIFMLLAPLLFISAIAFGFYPLIQSNQLIEPFKVAIVNEDTSLTSKSMIEQFEDSEELSEVVTFIHTDEQAALHFIQSNEIAAIVFIAEGFSASLRKGENKPIEVVGNPQRPLQSALFKEMMSSTVNLISAAQSGVNTVYHFLDGQVPPPALKNVVTNAIVHFSLHALGRNQIFEVITFDAIPSFTILEYYTTSAIIFILLLTGLFCLMILSDEDSQSMFNRLYVSGVKPLDWITAKFLTSAIIISLQNLSIFFLLYLFIDSFYVENVLMTFFVIVMTVITISAINTFIISFRMSALILGTISFLVYVIISYVGGAFIPIPLLPTWAETLSTLSLSKWALSGLLHSIFISKNDIVLKSIGSLSTITVLFLLFAYVTSHIRMRMK